jgi:P pilus assembly chaperone PapD
MNTESKKKRSSILRGLTIPLICLMAFGTMASPKAYASGFLLAPTRLVFEGGGRAQELTIMNQTDAAQTYRVRLEDRRLKENGEYDVITEPTEPFVASPMLRLSARQITLPARSSATLRVLLRKPANLTAGEYRSHLIVTELPIVEPPSTETDPNAPIAIRITTVLGISIPVLVRSGETSARAVTPTVKRVPVPDQPLLDTVDVRLESVGNRTIFLDLRLISTRQRRGEPIFQSKGTAIYAPVNVRSLSMSLSAEQTAKIRAGNVVLQYQEVSKDGAPIGPNAEVPF